jgi:hypothetical protein
VRRVNNTQDLSCKSKLTIIRNTGQIPLGVSSLGVTIFRFEVMGIFSLPTYEMCDGMASLRTVEQGVNVSLFCLDFFAGTIVAGRGTLVDLTSTLTMPLFARARCNGTVDMERSKEAICGVKRLNDRTIMVGALTKSDTRGYGIRIMEAMS